MLRPAPYSVEIYPSDSKPYYFERNIYYNGSQDVHSFHIPAIERAGDYYVDVYNWDEGHGVSRRFTVTPPPPAMDVYNATVSPATFYPLIRDGYLDNTKISYHLNQRANVVAVVRNSIGGKVRRVELGEQSVGARSWTWDGRKDDGTTLNPGAFTITMTATNAHGSRDSVDRNVTAATATVTRQATKSRWGNDGMPATRGACSVTRDSYDGTATLDCWGGRYAQMRYAFSIPGSATNVRWGVRGSVSDLDMCCNGRITKSGTRPSAGRYVVRAQVTGWRAYDVHKAWVTYNYKKQI